MTSETCFIEYLENGCSIRLSNGVTLSSQNKELFFIRGKWKDVLCYKSPGVHLLTISRNILCKFIQLLDVELFQKYNSVDIPVYITYSCSEGMDNINVITELCVSNNNDAVIPSIRKQLLLMTLMSCFLENRFFLPLLKMCLRKNMKEQVIIIVTGDISEKWSIEKVAARLCVSQSLLKKRLKNENTSYSQVVLECRMQKARELLSLQRLSVKQLAGLCGYRSVAYFIAVFKRYYGYTPCEYGAMNCCE